MLGFVCPLSTQGTFRAQLAISVTPEVEDVEAAEFQKLDHQSDIFFLLKYLCCKSF